MGTGDIFGGDRRSMLHTTSVHCWNVQNYKHTSQLLQESQSRDGNGKGLARYRKGDIGN